MIEEVDFDFAKCGHSLCIVDTKGSHSDLTDEYAAIRTAMESVAEFFGKKVLREVSEEDFQSKIRELRPAVGDRAILRAMHFYADNARVLKAVSYPHLDVYKRQALRLVNSSLLLKSRDESLATLDIVKIDL